MLPNCPKCNSEYTYEDGNLLICPECAYEWTPGLEAASDDDENVVKNVLIATDATNIEMFDDEGINVIGENVNIIEGVDIGWLRFNN